MPWPTASAAPRGFADDYVHMAEAALQLYESTGEKRYVERRRPGCSTLDAKFWDEARGGYYFTAHDAEQLIIRTRMIFDQPAPSSNGAMIAVLTRLALITGENDYGMRAQTMLQAFAGEFARNWISCGEYLNGFEIFRHRPADGGGGQTATMPRTQRTGARHLGLAASWTRTSFCG